MDVRPLSNWVVSVRSIGDGTARWDHSANVNDGDERADARRAPRFAEGWQRRRVLLDGVPDVPAPSGVLGLANPDSGRIVVELDELARPIPISQNCLEILERVEANWPAPRLTAADRDILRDEDTALCYLLLSRLSDEGRPSADTFHILPWRLVTQLVREVCDALQGSSVRPRVRLRHYFTPVGSRFTAALEQLAAGVRAALDGDTAGGEMTVRAGSTALCARLLKVDVARVPRPVRESLIRLVDVLVSHDPFVRHCARRVIERLAGSSGTDAERGDRVRLTAELRPAAAGDRGIRRHTRQLRGDPFIVDLTVTDTGRLEIGVSVEPAPGWEARAADSYGVVLLRLGIDGVTYLVPLHPWGDDLAGVANLPLPAGEFEIELTGPPIGLAEVKFVEAGELRRSLQGARTRAALRPWRDLAARLPAAHPLHALLAEVTGEPR